MESNHNHTISQMKPNNKTCHLIDGIQLTVPYSSFNIFASFCCIVYVAFMPTYITQNKDLYTHKERRGSNQRITLREPFETPQVREITFHTNLPKIWQHNNYINYIPKFITSNLPRFGHLQIQTKTRRTEYQYIQKI